MMCPAILFYLSFNNCFLSLVRDVGIVYFFSESFVLTKVKLQNDSYYFIDKSVKCHLKLHNL